jgi:hypothetical protein
LELRTGAFAAEEGMCSGFESSSFYNYREDSSSLITLQNF